MKVVVDTNIFMDERCAYEVFNEYDDIFIPVEVLSELDNLKTKDGLRGYLARNGIRAIRENIDDIDFLVHDDVVQFNRNRMIVDDLIIEHCKKDKLRRNDNQFTLITNDIGMEMKAKSYNIKTENFYGVEASKPICSKKVFMTIDEYDTFKDKRYSEKLDDVPIGQFAQILNTDNTEEVLGEYRFLGEGLWDLMFSDERIRNYAYDVYARDFYQRCAIKSLEEDDITVITGPAGTGKTLLSLAEGLKRINQEGATMHIFVNPVKTRDTEQLGYYPGTRDEKLLSSSIGGILASKLGDIIEVERLMQDRALKIYPFSDIRGIEIREGDVMYITEAQNLSIDLIKLAIQRCADGAKIIIEGDSKAQVDKRQFEGVNNGLQRVIEVFTGTEVCDFGYIDLPIIYRSKVAIKAEEL